MTDTITAARFRVDVTENIATAGMGTTKAMKYRWTVTDRETDQVVKTGYGFTIMSSQMVAEAHIRKIVKRGRIARFKWMEGK